MNNSMLIAVEGRGNTRRGKHLEHFPTIKKNLGSKFGSNWLQIKNKTWGIINFNKLIALNLIEEITLCPYLDAGYNTKNHIPFGSTPSQKRIITISTGPLNNGRKPCKYHLEIDALGGKICYPTHF